MAKKKHKIGVALGSDIKRSAVLINPKEGTVIDEGANGAQLAKRRYARR
jgi:hypothetical protein